MITLFLSASYKCNEKCIFCPCASDARQYNSLTLAEMKESLDAAIEKTGVEMVLLSGGEPTLHKDILPFIEYIMSKNIKLGILSNALKFASKDYLEKFISISGTNFEFTTAFHSHDAAIHDKITQLPNSFNRSLAGVNNLIEKGVSVTVKYNINNLSYRLLPEYVDWLYSVFPDSVSWVMCNIDMCGIAMLHKEEVAVSFPESKSFLEKSLDRVIEYRRQGRNRFVKVFNTPLCCIDPYYWSFLQKSEGGVIPALRLPYENSDENELKLNVTGDGGAIFTPCKECQLQNLCPGTWLATGKMYEEFFKAF